MGKLPYINEAHLFMKCDFKHAEEVLAEYNDFYGYNMAQLRDLYHTAEDVAIGTEEDEIDAEKRIELANKNATEATEHFKKLFGSHDFAESAMVGFLPSWYDLQKILLNEYKNKIPIHDSAMNGIAPALRTVASILLFAENLTRGLTEKYGTPEEIQILKYGFKQLMQRIESGESLEIPEYTAEKKAISKLKTPAQFIEYCEKLFKAGA